MKDADIQEQVHTSSNKGICAQLPNYYHPVVREGLSRNPYQSNPLQGSYHPRSNQEHVPYQEWNGENQSSFRPFERVDASLQSTGQGFIQSQSQSQSQPHMSQPQFWDGATDENISKQEEVTALPLRGMPAGNMPNGFDPQQYTTWNVMHSQILPGDYGNQMQHVVNSGHNRWISAWQDSSPFMEPMPYAPYGSGHMQMGPSHTPCDWPPQSTGTMANAYPHFYTEGYYSSGSSGTRQEASPTVVGESDRAAPPSFGTYGHYHQEPHVYLPPANQQLPGFGTPGVGADQVRTVNKAASMQDFTSQENHEKTVDIGGQVEQKQPQSIPVNAPRQSVSSVKTRRQAKMAKEGSAGHENFVHVKDVEIEGPQAKKLRECSEVDAHHVRSCQSSCKAGVRSSSNVAEASALDGAPSSKKCSVVQGSSIHSANKDTISHSLSLKQASENTTDQCYQYADMVNMTSQGSRPGRQSNPSTLRTNDARHGEISATFMPGEGLNRDHTRSTSSVCSFENGAGPLQSNFNPGARFVTGFQKLPLHGINSGFRPEVYREEFSSTGINNSASTFQGQSWADLHMRQLRDQAQVASPSSMSTPQRTSACQQSESTGKGLLSNAATQEQHDTQQSMLKPCNIGESPGFINASSVKYQDANIESFNCANPSIVSRGDFTIADPHPEVQPEKIPYSMSYGYPSHVQSQTQTPELVQFEYSKAGPLETGAQLRGFSRRPMGKFYPPPPFYGHPLHLHRESGTATKPCFEGEILPEASASINYESVITTSGPKDLVLNPVNYQTNGGYTIGGPTFYPVADGLGRMGGGAVLPESAQVHKLPISSMNKPHLDSTSLYSYMPHKVLPRSGTHHSSMTVESQGLARPTQMLREDDLKASEPSEPPDLPAHRSLRQGNGLDYPLGHYSDQLASKEYSTLPECEPALTGRLSFEHGSHHIMKSNYRAPTTLQPKKRKKSALCLIPWHVLTSQPRGQLPSISKAELMWATSTNRLVDKDGGEALNLSLLRAETRLRFTTQLMQQIFLPLPGALLHGKQPVNFECGVYILAKSVLGEACRLIAGEQRENQPDQNSTEMKVIVSNGRTITLNLAKEVAMAKLVERLMERVKRLDLELARLNCSMPVLELRRKSHDFERLSIVHRLGKHHGLEFSKNLLENRLVDAISNQGPLKRKTPPQKYVIAVPMPRMLPEGARCLSL